MERQDNKDELRAEEWLARQGCGQIRRVCCDPPDYLVGDRYAVEVTRLNGRITPSVSYYLMNLGECDFYRRSGATWTLDRIKRHAQLGMSY